MNTYKTIEIGAYGLAVLQDKVADLNRRAAKHGLAPVAVDVLRTVAFVRLASKGRFHLSEPLHTVAISGVEPCIQGWRFVGKIEFASFGNVVKPISEESLDARYRTVGPICEHCNSKRRRNDIFILRHESGEEKLVGRNCLADFLRDGDAETLARFAEFADQFTKLSESVCEGDYESFGEGRPAPYVTMLNYLAMTSCVIRKFGWLSKTASREVDAMPTTYWLGCCYFGRKTAEFIEKNELYPNEKDLTRAAAALAWATTKRGDASEYLDTIARLAGCENVQWRYDGYIASIISAYARETEQEIERKKRKAERCFIGTVGERLRSLPVEVLRLRFTDGFYGPKTIVTLEATVGDKRAVLTWFATGGRDGDFSEGDKIVVDATVKKHESDDKYGDSTIVSRVSVKG
jgi:hypothetical protein